MNLVLAEEIYRIKRAECLETLRSYRVPFPATWTVTRFGAIQMAAVKVRLTTPSGAIEGNAGFNLDDIDAKGLALAAKEATTRAMATLFDEMNPQARALLPPPLSIYGGPVPKRDRVRL